MARRCRLPLVLALTAGLLLAPAPPMALAQAPMEVWVCLTGNCGQTPSYSNIQTAVDAVAAGGTVNVAAGRYPASGSLTLTIGKALTMRGAGATTEVHGTVDLGALNISVRDIRFVGPTGPSPTGYIVRLNGANGAVLQDCTLSSIQGFQRTSGLRLQNTSNATIRRVTVTSINAAPSEFLQETAGVLVEGGSGNSFEQLTVSGVSSTHWPNGVLLAGPTQNNTFSDLTVSNISTNDPCCSADGLRVEGGSGQTVNGAVISGLQSPVRTRGVFLSMAPSTTLRRVRFDRGSANPTNGAIGLSLGGSSNVVVQDCEITNARQGIFLEGGSASATVTGCLLTGNEYGVDLFVNATAILQNNHFSGSSLFGVRNNSASPPIVNAVGNWWGSPTGPTHASNAGGVGHAVSNRVTFGPWLGDGTDTNTATGFQPNASPQYAIPTQLAFRTQPGGASPGSPLSPQPVVWAQDAAGHRGYNFAGAVSLALASNPGGATLSGTSTLNAVNGVAAFAGLALSQAGTGYTLRATSSEWTATSNPFSVANPPPAIAGLAPTYARAGGGPFTLSLSGTGFASGAQVRWNGAVRSTTFASATQLTAQILAEDVATVGTAHITVLNPDGGLSNTQALAIRLAPATTYVNAAWAHIAADADPDGTGPATHLGYDAFATMAAALSAAAPGSRIVAASGSAFAGGLTVAVAGLTIDLNGATVGPGSPAFTVAANDVTIHNGTMDGAGGGAGDSAILVHSGVARLWVHTCEIKNWGADGIRTLGAVTDLKIMDNHIHHNGGDGIRLAEGPGGTVAITGNSLRANSGVGIRVLSGSVVARYNEWGHLDGPAAGDGVSGAVDAQPWVFGRVYADVAPHPAQVAVGSTVDVDVRVEARSLYGAQLTLTFDPGRLEVVSTVASGVGYFSGSMGATVAHDNATGTLVYHRSQQAGEGAFDGSGRLLTVRFRAKAIGTTSAITTIAIAGVRLAAVGGIPIRVDSVAGDTLAILGTAVVRGVVRLQGRGDWTGATVDLQPSVGYGLDPAPATTDAWGRFEFGVSNDTYPITARMPRYLAAATTVAVTGGTRTLPTVELLGGDVDGAGGISIADITAISGLLFGTQVNPVTTAADINGDGWVNILDLVIAAGNFGLSASPWEG